MGFHLVVRVFMAWPFSPCARASGSRVVDDSSAGPGAQFQVEYDFCFKCSV